MRGYVRLEDIVVFDPATRILYGIEELNPVPNGNAIQLTVPNALDALAEDHQNAGIRTPGRRVSSTKTAKKPRKTSAWNNFVSAEMPKVLKKHPRFTPQRAMKEVSKRWRSSPKNPNRRRKR